MADYGKTTNFTAKDALSPGDPEKTILGADVDTEFDNIETAIGTKADITGDSFTGAINENKGDDIASATSIDIGASSGNFVDITGTTTITSLGTVQAGARRVLQFDGSLTLTYNATSLILPGNVDIITQAGDVAEFISLGGSNWVCTNYQRDGSPYANDITDYVYGTTEYVESTSGADDSPLDIQAIISTTFETIGPTGSSATNIWTSMNSMPTAAKWVDIRVEATAENTAGTSAVQTVHARPGGSTGGASSTKVLECRIAATGATQVSTSSVNTFRMPVDSSNRFEMSRVEVLGNVFTCNIFLIGWGI